MTTWSTKKGALKYFFFLRVWFLNYLWHNSYATATYNLVGTCLTLNRIYMWKETFLSFQVFSSQAFNVIGSLWIWMESSFLKKKNSIHFQIWLNGQDFTNLKWTQTWALDCNVQWLSRFYEICAFAQFISVLKKSLTKSLKKWVLLLCFWFRECRDNEKRRGGWLPRHRSFRTSLFLGMFEDDKNNS